MVGCVLISASCALGPGKGRKAVIEAFLAAPVSKTGFDSVSRPKRYQPRRAPLSRLCCACFRHSELADGSATFQLAPLHLVTCGPAAIFAPHAVFVAGLCDNCVTAAACPPHSNKSLPAAVRATDRFVPQAGVEKATQHRHGGAASNARCSREGELGQTREVLVFGAGRVGRRAENARLAGFVVCGIHF